MTHACHFIIHLIQQQKYLLLQEDTILNLLVPMGNKIYQKKLEKLLYTWKLI